MVRLRYIFSVIVIAAFTACQHDIVNENEFSVFLDDSNSHLAGEPIVFNIHGEPDNLLFYSGEPGSVYGEEASQPVVIKNIQNYMHTYEYTYEEPGTYKVTFLVSNTTYMYDFQTTSSVSVTIIENLNN